MVDESGGLLEVDSSGDQVGSYTTEGPRCVLVTHDEVWVATRRFSVLPSVLLQLRAESRF
jgi:hypothetical protein